MRARADIRIGVSGWTYSPWRGAFYPKGLPHKRELSYAATIFNAVEINGTFYGMQRPQNFAAWAEAVPEDFRFAVKGSRYITHMLKLKHAETALANFFASGPLALGDRLGPILWQFPARFAFDADRMARFLEQLPYDGAAAARMARNHDDRLRAPPFLDVDPKLPIRHCVEIRHDSFRDAKFIELLKQHNVALVTADTVEWPLLMDLTADFAYCRLHGSTELYRSGYSDADLDRWAARVADWASGRRMTDGNFVLGPTDDQQPRDVFLFFDNTDKLEAPGDARGLMRRLGIAEGGGWQDGSGPALRGGSSMNGGAASSIPRG